MGQNKSVGSVKKKKTKEKKEDKESKVKKNKDLLKVNSADMKMYRAWVKMARAKRKDQFEPIANRLRAMYRGEDKPDWGDENSVHINLMFANIESAKPSIFFRNPKIYIKPTQETFVLEDGRQLDGRKAAGLIEDAVNYILYAQKMKRIIKDVRNDALISTYGIMEIGYEGEISEDAEQGFEYVREDEIYGSRVSPLKFLVDVEAKDCLTFKDARFVGKEYEMSLKDLKEDDYYENTEDIEADSIGYGEKISDGSSKGTKTLLDVAGKDYGDSDDAQKVTMYILWIRPSKVERRHLKKGDPGGKVVIMSEQGKKPHKVLKWAYKMKGFPFRGLAFYRDNEQFYPISDVAQYERQIQELDQIRTAQLNHVKDYGQKKILINVDAFASEEEITKLTDGSAGPFIKVNVGDKDVSTAAKVMSFGSAPAEMFMADRKVIEDADRVSGYSDLKRGMVQAGMDTATETREVSAMSAMRFVEKKDEVHDFFQDIARMIVSMVKQFWTSDKAVRRLGTLTPEWTDAFSSKDIQIEDDVEVDIGEMVPTNEIIRKKQAMDLIELTSKGATIPAVRQKLAEEGYEVNLSEAIKDAMYALGVRNDKILQKITPDKYIEVLKGLVQNQVKTANSGGQSRPSGGTPSTVNTIAGANRGLGGPAYPTEERPGV